jgi:hypothetical protein
VWQLDGGRGMRALSRPERVAIAVAFVVAWVATHDGLLLLLTIAAAFRAFAGAPGPAIDGSARSSWSSWARSPLCQRFGFRADALARESALRANAECCKPPPSCVNVLYKARGLRREVALTTLLVAQCRPLCRPSRCRFCISYSMAR